jgi:DNA polymerase-3 subunit delta
MGELTYIDFQRSADKPKADYRSAPAFLVFGDEMLCQRVVERLVPGLLRGASSTHGLDVIEGLNENLAEALSRLNTFSLLSPGKVVHFKDARLFYGKTHQADLLGKARSAAAKSLPRAARILCDLLGVLSLGFDDLKDPAEIERLVEGFEPERDREWFDRALALAVERGMTPGPAADVQSLLEQALAAGFPKNHHLVVTTDHVDRRRTLFKRLAEVGSVIDCTVPSGGGGRDGADAVVRDLVEERLSEAGKRMDPEAVALLVEKTGASLRLIAGNIDRLVDHAGDRERIEAADVERILLRTRQDPLYAFTDAVTDGDLAASLFYLDSLLGGGQFDHPLPLLAAVVNQVRRLLVVKDFVEGPMGGVWRRGMSYGRFQQQVLPAVQAFDAELADRLSRWQDAASDPAGGGKAGPKGKKKGPASDLYLSRSSRSPYPIYKLFMKSERFSTDALVEALAALAEADIRLKRSGADGRLAIEQVLFRLCGAAKGGAPPGARPGAPPRGRGASTPRGKRT